MNLPVRNTTDFVIVCLILISFPVLPDLKDLMIKKNSVKDFWQLLKMDKIKIFSLVALIIVCFILSVIKFLK